MNHIERNEFIIGPDDPILITGANGFIGRRVVASLLERGFRNLLCFARPSSTESSLVSLAKECHSEAKITVVRGNLLSRQDCEIASKNVAVIFHLAAGT